MSNSNFSGFIYEPSTGYLFRKSNPTKKVGTFNIGSKKGFSKYHFSILFAKLLKLDSNLIIKTKLKNLNLIEKRHYDMRMNVKKFENTFKYKLPLLKNEIQKESLVYE